MKSSHLFFNFFWILSIFCVCYGFEDDAVADDSQNFIAENGVVTNGVSSTNSMATEDTEATSSSTVEVNPIEPSASTTIAEINFSSIENTSSSITVGFDLNTMGATIAKLEKDGIKMLIISCDVTLIYWFITIASIIAIVFCLKYMGTCKRHGQQQHLQDFTKSSATMEEKSDDTELHDEESELQLMPTSEVAKEEDESEMQFMEALEHSESMQEVEEEESEMQFMQEAWVVKESEDEKSDMQLMPASELSEVQEVSSEISLMEASVITESQDDDTDMQFTQSSDDATDSLKDESEMQFMEASKLSEFDKNATFRDCFEKVFKGRYEPDSPIDLWLKMMTDNEPIIKTINKNHKIFEEEESSISSADSSEVHDAEESDDADDEEEEDEKEEEALHVISKCKNVLRHLEHLTTSPSPPRPKLQKRGLQRICECHFDEDDDEIRAATSASENEEIFEIVRYF